LENLLPNVAWKTGGTVVPYFSKALFLLWPDLSQAMQNFLRTLSNPKVYVTGHSLGGALASLAATLLYDSNIATQPIVYTFGQPRTGDYTYAVGFDSIIKTAWRVVHYIDPVPHLPFCGKVQIKGISLPICSACSNQAYHHGIEVYYNSTTFPMAYNQHSTECVGNYPRNEALSCSDGVAAYAIECISNGFEKCLEYHQYYFGNIQVGKCGESGCTDQNWCNHGFPSL